MNDFVDARDSSAVEQVLAQACTALGSAAVLAQLTSLLPVELGRPRGLLRAERPTRITVGEEALALFTDRAPQLQHVVGGVVLSNDTVSPMALPGVLAALVVRALSSSGRYDDAAVLLTSLRDAVQAGGS
ncbi:MAG: hypothetical protein JWO12_273 [Frankiales bacterium]|nr:hypothetical protein [Frankiales bacterium]